MKSERFFTYLNEVFAFYVISSQKVNSSNLFNSDAFTHSQNIHYLITLSFYLKNSIWIFDYLFLFGSIENQAFWYNAWKFRVK